MGTDTKTTSRWKGAAWWLPGLLVALCAAAATAHGLYEVALVCDTPPVIAVLYPVITDGLALVAYAATAKLSGSGLRYAWSVVVLAAGLSGVAQAINLAGATPAGTTALRVVIGAWPAIAAAIVAHLLFLLASERRPAPSIPVEESEPPTTLDAERLAVEASVQTSSVQPSSVQRPAVQEPVVQPDPVLVQDPVAVAEPEPSREARTVEFPPVPVERSTPVRTPVSPARARAEKAAQKYLATEGDLPTVSQLMELAEVSRGTAGEALKPLRKHPSPLHLITDQNTHEAHS